MSYGDEEINTTEVVGERLNLTSATIRKRLKVLGIKPELKGRTFIYSENDIEKIRDYQRRKYISNKIDLNTRFAVIELFTTMNENSVKNISEATGIPKCTVNYIIDEWLRNKKTIIVESKMNEL